MAELTNELIFVLGPTASGKSQWAMQKALESGAAIINADSVQVYKGLDIGSNKPSLEDRAKVPHFLFDIVEPHQDFTAGDYARAAHKIIITESASRNLLVVGGSGFYIQALEKGMYPVKVISSEIKDQVRAWIQAKVHFEKLMELDPVTANKLARNDEYRIQRALELTISESRPISQIQAEFEAKKEQDPSGLKGVAPSKKIGILVDRDVLRQRIEKRTLHMLQQGLIEEVKRLLELGYAGTRALATVGYKEVVQYLKNEIDRDEMKSLIVTHSMQLAKRQMTWFRRDQQIEWHKSQGVDKITFSSP